MIEIQLYKDIPVELYVDYFLWELSKVYTPSEKDYTLQVDYEVWNKNLYVSYAQGNKYIHDENNTPVYKTLEEFAEWMAGPADDTERNEYIENLLREHRALLEDTGVTIVGDREYTYTREKIMRTEFLLCHRISYILRIEEDDYKKVLENRIAFYRSFIDASDYTYEKLQEHLLHSLWDIMEEKGKITIGKEYIENILFFYGLMSLAIERRIILWSYWSSINIEILESDWENTNKTSLPLGEFYNTLNRMLEDMSYKDIHVEKSNNGTIAFVKGEKHIRRSEARYVDLEKKFAHADIKATTHDGETQKYVVTEKIKFWEKK